MCTDADIGIHKRNKGLITHGKAAESHTTTPSQPTTIKNSSFVSLVGLVRRMRSAVVYLDADQGQVGR